MNNATTMTRLPSHDTADLAAYGRADRRPGALRGVAADLRGTGHRVAGAPVASAAPLTTAQIAAMDLLRRALVARDERLADE